VKSLLLARRLAIAIILSTIILASSAFGAQQSSTRAYPVGISAGDLAWEKESGYDLVTLPGYDLMSKVGEPQLPVRYVTVALPPGMLAVDLEVTYSNARELYGAYSIKPGEKPVPISLSGRLPRQEPVPDRAVYSSANPYPGKLAVFIGNGSLSGHPVADVAVYPVQYVPSTGRVTVYEDIEIRLILQPNPDPVSIKVRSDRAESMFAQATRNLVINPDEVADRVAQSGGPSPLANTVEYLIITNSAYNSQFQVLADWETKKGIPAQVIDTSWIIANYSGEVTGDDQDRIRQCIKDYWQNKGTVYVLLGGDITKVPYRPAYVIATDYGYNIPADLYFADLDGTWNANGNSQWGEYPADGVDMYADVYVGRAPVESTAEVDKFVNKVLQYEGEASQPPLPADYQTDMLFMASKLDDSTDTAILKNQIDNESVPVQFNITKLYESSGNLDVTSAVNAMNEGQNIINHTGHGDNTQMQVGAGYLYNGHMSSLTNGPRFTGVLYSVACFAANFPWGDCIAESFVNAANGGGDFIGNSRYGWYYVGNPSSGLSARFDRYFFRALLHTSYNYYHLGEAFGVGRNFGVGIAKGDDNERYCLYELNLLGDPEKPIYKYLPAQLAASHPATLPTGSSGFSVHVTAGGSPVTGATVCLWKGSEVYLVGTTSGSGDVTFYPNPSTEGTMYVTATMFDHLPAQSTAQVETSGCEWTYAPNPEPYSSGALFGQPSAGYPGWVWFSIPLDPDNCCGSGNCYDPNTLMGFACNGVLWYWDKYNKNTQVYNPPFLQWNLNPGNAYLMRLQSAVNNPGYQGVDPGSGFGFLMGKKGWTWVGMPGTGSLGYPNFMDQVSVQYPVGGTVRTATQDRNSADPWLNWGWSFWDTYGQSAKTFTPYLAFGNNTAYPWIGYRVYVNVGTATSDAGTDQVKLIWP
jgi:hypothetical protein